MGKVAQRRVDRFEDLRIWQTGRDLARGVYRAADVQPLGRDYAMLNQMKRAVISISSNIAEGYERGTRKQQIEFCYTAKGSAGELRSQIIIAHDVGLLNGTAFKWLLDRCELCSRQLATYIRHLKQTRNAIQGAKFVADERVGESGDAWPAVLAGEAVSFPTSPPPHLPTDPSLTR